MRRIRRAAHRLVRQVPSPAKRCHGLLERDEANPASLAPRVPRSDADATPVDQLGEMAPPRTLEALHGLLGKLKRGGLAGRSPSHAPALVPNGAQFVAETFSGADGSRPYKLYIPSRYRGDPVPLVVMLHGCTQSADDFAAGTRMNGKAEHCRRATIRRPARMQSRAGSDRGSPSSSLLR
jgi:hypothetical protein